MVDYGSYYVDPLRYQQAGMNALARSSEFKAERQNALERQRSQREQNALAREREDRLAEESQNRENRLASAETRAGETHNLNKQEAEQRIRQKQIDFLAGLADSIDDEQSYQNARNLITQLTQRGMFGPELLNDLPDTYDPNYITQARKTLGGLRSDKKPTKEGGFTLSEGQTRYDKHGRKIASVPKSQKDKTEKTASKLLNEYKAYKNSITDESGDTRYKDPVKLRKLNKAYSQDKKLIKQGKEPHYMDDLMGKEEPIEPGLQPPAGFELD